MVNWYKHQYEDNDNMNQYIILGINDDQDTCDLCGKTNLKQVVWLQNSETQDTQAVGTICAAKLQKINIKEQRRQEKDFIKLQQLKADKIIKNSNVYLEYNKALQAAPRICDVGLENRLEFLRPFTEALNKLREQVKNDYNLTFI